MFSFSSWFTNHTFLSCHLHFLASAWSLSRANEKTFHSDKMGYGISAFFLNTVASVCTCRQNLIHSRASSKISLVFLHLDFSFLAVYRWIFRLSDSMPRCRTKHLRYASSTPLDPPCIPHSERREPQPFCSVFIQSVKYGSFILCECLTFPDTMYLLPIFFPLTLLTNPETNWL